MKMHISNNLHYFTDLQKCFFITGHAQGHTPDIQSVMVEPQKLNVGYVIFIIAAASIFTLVLGAIILCLGMYSPVWPVLSV